jgi:hypothetical protein
VPITIFGVKIPAQIPPVDAHKFGKQERNFV